MKRKHTRPCNQCILQSLLRPIPETCQTLTIPALTLAVPKEPSGGAVAGVTELDAVALPVPFLVNNLAAADCPPPSTAEIGNWHPPH